MKVSVTGDIKDLLNWCNSIAISSDELRPSRRRFRDTRDISSCNPRCWIIIITDRFTGSQLLVFPGSPIGVALVLEPFAASLYHFHLLSPQFHCSPGYPTSTGIINHGPQVPKFPRLSIGIAPMAPMASPDIQGHLFSSASSSSPSHQRSRRR